MKRILWRIFIANHAVLVVAAFLILWEIGTEIWKPATFILPAPSQVFVELFKRPSVIWRTAFTRLRTP